jgi:hypothetical protein
MLKWIICFICIFLYKLSLNIVRIVQCKKYMDEYMNWVDNHSTNIYQKKHDIIALWKSAGLRDKIAPRTEPLGLGQIVNYNKSVFDSFPSKDADMAYATHSLFNEAIGIYKSRLKKTIIPFYWIEGVLFLPKIIIEYFDVKNEVLIKFFQGIYWIAGIIFTFILAVYPTELKKIINSLLGR